MPSTTNATDKTKPICVPEADLARLLKLLIQTRKNSFYNRDTTAYPGVHETQVGLQCGKHALMALLTPLHSTAETINAFNQGLSSALACSVNRGSENLDVGSIVAAVTTMGSNFWQLSTDEAQPGVKLDAMVRMQGVNGFLVNTGNHWVAIRKANDKWYMVDSLQDDVPELTWDQARGFILKHKPSENIIAYAIATFKQVPESAKGWANLSVK